MLVQLVMFKADGQRREFTLRKDVTVIGRAIECDFQIPLLAVSRKHCQITLRQDHIAIKDLGSSNGTFLNDQRLQEADLEAGDKLAVGPVIFTVVVDGQPADIAAVRTTARPSAVGDDLEIDGGTVDVEAQQELHPAPSVKPL
jgi:pSer/pThr/pTyr-binding forkhead associated (FHA) protein